MPDVCEALRRIRRPVERQFDSAPDTLNQQFLNRRRHPNDVCAGELNAKPVDDFAFDKMAIDNLVDVVRIDVRVPDAIG